jgi:hypothetical protein
MMNAPPILAIIVQHSAFIIRYQYLRISRVKVGATHSLGHGSMT